MSTFADDIRYGFLQRYGAVAQIILINVAVYLLMALGAFIAFLMGQGGAYGDAMNYLALPINLQLLAQRPWTIFTSMFVHDFLSIGHVFFNMLFLFSFGSIFQQYLGNQRVWSTFVLGHIAGITLTLILLNLIPTLGGVNGFAVGASAGIMAIIVATAVLLPNYSVGVIFLGPVPLKWIALFIVVLDFLSIPAGNPGGHIAHLGGALFGFSFMYFYRRGVNISQPFDSIAEAIKTSTNPSARRMRVVASKARPGNKPSEEEVDRLLDKIRAVGYDKLSKEEKQTLYNASKE